MRIRLTRSGDASPDLVWSRYVAPVQWTGWASHLTSVDASTELIEPGTTGRVVVLGAVAARFRVLDVDPVSQRWSWRVRLGPVEMTLRHDVVDRPGGGSTAGVAVDGPGVLVVPYLPVMRWALGRLVAAELPARRAPRALGRGPAARGEPDRVHAAPTATDGTGKVRRP